MDKLKDVFEILLTIMGIATALYYTPFLIRKGWNDAENRTKKVCDICFRDIKKWNEEVKKVKPQTLENK